MHELPLVAVITQLSQISIATKRSTEVALQDFPSGAPTMHVGHQGATWQLFGKLVCKNADVYGALPDHDFEGHVKAT